MNTLSPTLTYTLFPSPFVIHTPDHIPTEIGFCDAEVTEFLLWPDTPAGTIQTLSCPNTTTTIDRSCSLSGEWDIVDPSLCIPFSSISTVSTM